MKDLLKRINGFTILIAMLTFVIGWQFGHRDVVLQWQKYSPSLKITDRTPPKEIGVDFKLFWDTWDLLSREYIDKKAIDPTKLYNGAISGMVSAVGDPYTMFLAPEAQKASNEDLNGSFQGVGIELGFNTDKRLIVMTPLEGTPAEKAGVKAQDLILKIDDKDTVGITLADAVKLIRGPKGSVVKLSIFRDGFKSPKDFSMNRDTIIIKSVTYKTDEKNGSPRGEAGKKIGIIKLNKFGDRTESEWNNAVTQALSDKVSGLVLDVRNNPGGYLEGAVYIASEFLDGGNVVLQENGAGERFSYKVDRKGKLLNMPMVVLINKGSASASEIVSGALQDRKRAKLVGEKSFGKGTVQEAKDLGNGAGIHITTAKWLTPNGRWVNATQGLEPDVLVEIKDQAPEDKTDLQLNKALELLN